MSLGFFPAYRGTLTAFAPGRHGALILANGDRPMTELKAVNLAEVSETIKRSVKPVSILWQAPDTIAFVARGRQHRSEFHADPSDEVMYMIKGEMNLHYLTPEGEEKVALIREGEIIYCPA